MFQFIRNCRSRSVAVGLSMVASTVPISTNALAQTTLKLAHASTIDSLINRAVVRFADEVKTATGGKLLIQIYPNGQLGDEAPIADGVGAGSIEIGLGGVADPIDSKLNVVTLPFLFKDAKNVHDFLDGPVGKEVFSLGMARGYLLLGALDSGFRQFATSKRPIVVPDDIKGLKIRTPPNPVILATIKQLGALAQSIPFGQVYTSLQAKVVDGVEPEIRDFYDEKWYESAKYLSLANYIWTPNYWFMNKAKFDALPDDQKKAITDAAANTTSWYRSQLDAVVDDVVSKLKAKGVAVNIVDAKPFQSLVDPIYATFGKEWGNDFVQKIRDAAAASGAN